MALVGGAWPALVELTPAADRPWVSGTSNNKIWQLITEYNGAGRLDGQTGGPAGAGGSVFGGTPGPLRLLNSALGGQAGWLSGFAPRERSGGARGQPVAPQRSAQRLADRGGRLLLVVAVVFSEAKGIFHPYYVSLLAPFAAMLTGAGVAQLRERGRLARVVAPAAIVAGVACEVAVLHDYPGELRWLVPALIVVGAGAAVVLAASGERAIRTAALLCAVAALLIGPGIWAVDTLSYATNGTFPSGGPRVGAERRRRARRRWRRARRASLRCRRRAGGWSSGVAAQARDRAVVKLFGAAPRRGAAGGAPRCGCGRSSGGRRRHTGCQRPSRRRDRRARAIGIRGRRRTGRRRGDRAPLGDSQTISQAIAYAKSHGGGTVAVASQSSAATEIVDDGAEVAGIGGFSGRESDVEHLVAGGRGEPRADPLGARRRRYAERATATGRYPPGLDQGAGRDRQGVQEGDAELGHNDGHNGRSRRDDERSRQRSERRKRTV